jgi:proline iminopeptidase
MRASISETEICYELHGQGPPMLLLHGGMGLDHSYFRPWLDPLGDAAQLIYYDQRGNGRSAQPPDWSAVDHGTWAEDADALREHLGHEKIVLFGHSYGGFLAQEYALRYPDRLLGLILCSTAPALDYPEVMLANARARGTPEQVEALGRALTARAPDDETAGRWWREIFPLYFRDPDPAVLEEAAERIRYSAGAWNRSLFELMPSFNRVDRLGEIRVPTLVLTGRDDWIMPPEQGGERLHAALGDSELVVFERSGHFPWIEERDAFLGVVRDWLHRVDTPG